MNVISLDLDQIDDSDRLRPVDMAWARVLAESMRDRGQLEPIEVRPVGEDGRYKLVIGAHRVAAARLNGDRAIDAKVFEGSPGQARLREIDENLCRHDLNDLDRAIFLGERKRLYEAENPPARGGRPRREKTVANMATVLRFTIDAARSTKMAERTIRRLVHRYENLTPAVRDRIRGTWLASSGKDLDAIAALEAELQGAVVELMLRPNDPPRSVLAARAEHLRIPQVPPLEADEEFRRLKSAWNATKTDAAKRQFIKWLYDPKAKNRRPSDD